MNRQAEKQTGEKKVKVPPSGTVRQNRQAGRHSPLHFLLLLFESHLKFIGMRLIVHFGVTCILSHPSGHLRATKKKRRGRDLLVT